MTYSADKDGNIYNENGFKLKPFEHSKGYLQFTEYNSEKYPDKKRKNWRIHRFVWIYHNGEIPAHLELDHINNDKTDNRLENLRLVTSAENNRDRDYVKLNEYKVAIIRGLYKTGRYSYRQLAKMFNVSYGHIGAIIRRELWN